MNCKTEVTVKRIEQKVSVRQNVYCEVDFTEDVFNVDTGELIKAVEWNNVYYPAQIEKKTRDKMINKLCSVEIAFFPVNRTHNEKKYTNIEYHLKGIELI